MKPLIRTVGHLANDLTGLFWPRRCAGCDRPLFRAERDLCLLCRSDLPYTRFHNDPQNKVERLFWGRVRIEAASALLQFNRHGKVQHMLHRMKYRGDEGIGRELGRLMARDLQRSERFRTLDTILAVPLHARKVRARGYNQAQLLADGFSRVWPLRSVRKELLRVVRTPTQTKRGRLERWRNVQEAFELAHPEVLRDAHVLLVDDVVTTGATIEGCIKALQVVPGIRVSVFTAACA